MENGKWLVLALTLVAGVYLIVNRYFPTTNDRLCPATTNDQRPTTNDKRPTTNYQWFDPNPSHINYMTAQQHADMEAFESFFSNDQRQALSRNDEWHAYWQTHDPQTLISLIQTEAVAVGFRPDAFQPFYDQLLTANFQRGPDWTNDQRPTTNDQLLTTNIISRLIDSFDYLGLVCSIIVFAFLWLSFRSIWLALIAFVPMALSWVWILALMQLFGLQFNIVNIILATFIFGQGDDYTIFIVEGLLYEHRTGKPMLPQYRQSIILSAFIMLIGIGILVFAQHPAMHSLGTVTLIGMSVVLIMAVTVPPLLFRLFSK